MSINHDALVRASRGERTPELKSLAVRPSVKAPLIAATSALALLGVAAWAALARGIYHPWPYHDDVTRIALPLVPVVFAGLIAGTFVWRRWRSPMRNALVFGPGVVIRTHGDGRAGASPMAELPPPVVSGRELRMRVAGREVVGRAPDTTAARQAAAFFAAHQHDPVPDIELMGRPARWPLRIGLSLLMAPLLTGVVAYGAWTANFVYQVDARWREGDACAFAYFARDIRTQAIDLVYELADLDQREARAAAACPDE